ncbi:MAG: glycosyltransferase family 39 protein [Deltaproteobacteria bacterium]|jgi:4-amino-4-deoxy-L-arabinose transferase-like glycosyltransferase|nr:glycosyltransferase family 39 protein [Deltaproteobacteria bacterium]
MKAGGEKSGAVGGLARRMRPPPSRLRPAGRAAAVWIGLFALGGSLFFFHLGSYALWEPDEARYAEIGREMAVSRDFIIPHLDQVPYVEKPPLLYWLETLSISLGGVNEGAARVPVALFALLALAATVAFCLRAGADRSSAFISGLVLATSALYAIMAQVLTTDMLLTALMSFAWFAFYLQWANGGRWWFLSSVAVALGVLAKGPVALVLLALPALSFLWWEGRRAGGWRLRHVSAGLALAAALALPWFVVVALREPGFLRFYLLGEHLARFFDPSYAHGEPFHYYLPVVLAGFMPWTLLWPALDWRTALARPEGRFCAAAAVCVIVFFSLASGKLIPYVLPAWPPLAVLTGEALGATLAAPARMGRLRRGWFMIAAGALAALGAGCLAAGLLPALARQPYVALTRRALMASGATLVAAGALAALSFSFSRIRVGVAAFGLAAWLALIIGGYGRIAAEPLRSYAVLGRRLAPLARHATVIVYPRYVQGIPFYCRCRVILVGPLTELAFGARHSQDASRYFFQGPDTLIHLWHTLPRPIVVIDRAALEPIAARLAPLQVVAAERDKVAIRPAAAPGMGWRAR